MLGRVVKISGEFACHDYRSRSFFGEFKVALAKAMSYSHVGSAEAELV